MSDHVVQQIRDALATALTGLTTTGANVHVSRGTVTRLAKSGELPALYIGLPRESIQVDGVSFPPLQQRTLDVPVAALVKDGDDAEAVLFQIQSEVETELYSAAPGTELGLGVRTLDLVDCDPDVDNTLDLPAARLVMTWRAQFFTVAGQPGTFA